MFRRNVIFAIVVAVVVLLLVGCAIPQTQPSTLDTVNEAWQIISQEYVDGTKLDQKKLAQGAVRGLVEAVNDPYTIYLEPETYQLQIKSLKGVYQGIGAHVNMKDDRVVVVAPIPGSPAEKAGIKPGDKILKVNGVSTEGKTLIEVVLEIQGPAGTAVKLEILHEGVDQPVQIEVIRAEIKMQTVALEMRDNFAYVRLTSFAETTPTEMVEALNAIPANAAGLVLDVRNNPGGSLQAVVDVASEFLKEGVVVSVVDNQGRKSVINVKSGGRATNIPMIILVNDHSASASEVLSGALQDQGRAKLAGKKTFGKGSVNKLLPLSDGSAVYLTIARWLTPSGRPIEGVGLIPDFSLDLEGEKLVDWALERLKSQQPIRTSAAPVSVPSNVLIGEVC